MASGELNRGYDNQCSRPNKRKTSFTNIESVPNELWFQIFLRLPDEDIYKGARLVCKNWHDLIGSREFVQKHLHQTTPGLVIKSLSASPSIFLTMRQGQIDMSGFNDEFDDSWSSCNNGLILCFHKRALCIANPATNMRFELPPITYKTLYSHGIAYATVANSIKYKVVHSYFWLDRDSANQIGCDIHTVGVDKCWRHVNFRYLSPASKLLLKYPSLTSEGFIHWTCDEATHVLTLNVKTEKFTETPIPEDCGARPKYIFSTGRSLTLLVSCGEFSWDFWELKSKKGEWTKLPTIDLEDRKCARERLAEESVKLPTPVGWLNYKEVLVFKFLRTSLQVLLLYDIRKQEIIGFFEIGAKCIMAQNFRRSLIWC